MFLTHSVISATLKSDVLNKLRFVAFEVQLYNVATEFSVFRIFSVKFAGYLVSCVYV